MSIEAIINKISDWPAEMFETSDLIYMGIFSSPTQACIARKNNRSPAFIKLSGKRVCYTKSAVIEWLRKMERETSWQR